MGDGSAIVPRVPLHLQFVSLSRRALLVAWHAARAIAGASSPARAPSIMIPDGPTDEAVPHRLGAAGGRRAANRSTLDTLVVDRATINVAIYYYIYLLKT